MEGSKGLSGLSKMTTDELLSRLQDPYNLQDPYLTEDIIALISKRTSTEENLAQKIWNSPNTMFILLKEVIALYRRLEQTKIDTADSNRVCNAIALIQCLASHPETRMPLLKAKIPVYLCPFLNTKSSERSFEHLRILSLGVLGALLKDEDQTTRPQIVRFLLESEVLPLCLRCMDVGAQLSKTVATFILMKILMQEEGLSYCCAYAERFYSVTTVLAKIVNNFGESSPSKLLKNIIQCYLRLSYEKRASEALCDCFPEKLRGSELVRFIQDDPATLNFLEQVQGNLARAQKLAKKVDDKDVKKDKK